MIIEGIGNGIKNPKRAAMYYKTEPFHVDVSRYTHTNNWEIIQSIKILASRGFVVDLIDRDHPIGPLPKNSYDLFLGLGVGNTGRKFVDFANISKAPKKILLAMGPQPDISNELVLKRYKMFHERTGVYAPPMRTVQDVIGEKFLEISDKADYIFNIGEKDTPSFQSFLKYKKPVINFFPSISPKVSYNPEWSSTRKRNKFLCFAGNGFICKGVDLVVEAFLKDTSKELHICGPKTEKSFFDYYEKKISNSPNIFYHGFITPGDSKFVSLASQCSFVVFHSSAEGCCTSVATAIKAGLVPIINPWTGIKIKKEEGFILSDKGDLIKNISDGVNKASSIKDSKYNDFLESILEKSKIFSQKSFTDSYSKAIDFVLEK